MVARRGSGLDELLSSVQAAAQAPEDSRPAFRLDYGREIEAEIAHVGAAYARSLPAPAAGVDDQASPLTRWVALKLLEGEGELPLALMQPAAALAAPAPVLPAVQAYLDAWAAEDYTSMYASVSSLTSDALAFETFEARHKDTALAMTLIDLETEIASAIVLSPTTAQAAYRVTYHTALVGDLSRDLMMNLTLESGAWRVAWEEGLILPELRGGNRLAMDVRVPVRGNIYDRNGEPLVIETGAVALGIVPGPIDPEREGRLVEQESQQAGQHRPRRVAHDRDILLQPPQEGDRPPQRRLAGPQPAP